MKDQQDEFSFEPRRKKYPDVPGAQNRDTSKQAARNITSRAEILRERFLEVLLRDGPKTCDEVAEILGESVLSIRPRASQLAIKKRIVDTGARRLTALNQPAIVWRIA